MGRDEKILTKLEEYIDQYLLDADNSAVPDDKHLFCALVQARVAVTFSRPVFLVPHGMDVDYNTLREASLLPGSITRIKEDPDA